LHLVGILFPHINDDALSKSHKILMVLFFRDYSVVQPCKWNSHVLVDSASRTDSVILRFSTVNEATLKTLISRFSSHS